MQEKYNEIVDAEDFESATLTVKGSHPTKDGEVKTFSFTLTVDAIPDVDDQVDVTFLERFGSSSRNCPRIGRKR